MKHPHWATHLSSLAALEILAALGLYAQSRSLGQWKSNSWALTWQGRARALLVEDTTLVLAESTVGVELAGEAEKAITAKPEALEPRAYNEAGCRREVETTPQEGERGPEA